MQEFPIEYKEKVIKKSKAVPEATYEPKHQLYNYLDFDFEEYIDNFDFYNVEDHLLVDSGLNLYTDKKGFVSVDIKRMTGVEFADNLNDYCKRVLHLTEYEVHIVNVPKNQISGNHVDHHSRIRKYNDLLDTMSDEVVFDYVKRYWIPLTDRKHGQYFELNGCQILNWKAGEVYRLWPAYPHCGANIGEDKRVFAIITGFDKPLEQIKKELTND